jgi:uncharacterized protein YbjT (DUF2867 family)
MGKKTFAISGATGNIGSVLAESLLSRGHQVRVIGRSKQRLQSLIERGARAHVGSLDDAEFLTDVFNGVDGVFTMIPQRHCREFSRLPESDQQADYRYQESERYAGG